MQSKRIDQITLQDLEDLVNTRQSENQRLEFKEEINYKDGEGKKKFLRGLAAFANTLGGYFIIGIKEENGEATELTGVELPDPDKYKLQLDQVIRDNLEPRLLGIQIRHFEFANSKFVIVIFVPRSSFPPHRMQNDTFYERTNTGKQPLNMDQIRRVFTRGASLREEMRNFVRERQDLVCTQRDGIVQFTNESVVLVHLIPFSSIESDVSVPINIELQRRLQLFVVPLGGAGHSSSFNADGLAFLDKDRDGGKYTQLFRNGVFEGACDYNMIRISENKKIILPSTFEYEVIEWLKNALKATQEIEILPPFQISITLQGVRDAFVSLGNRSFTSPKFIGKEILYLPSIILEDIDSLDFKKSSNSEVVQFLAQKLRLAFDVLWQASGYEQSASYENDGLWNPSL